jgi:acyl-CoA ligase (AMP-forming) (exosortase A-associated)
MITLLSGLTHAATNRTPAEEALRDGKGVCTYEEFEDRVDRFAHGLAAAGLDRSARVAVYAEKSIEAVVALFGASRAGGVVVPVNPLLRPEQVAYILRDCNVAVLATTTPRLAGLVPVLPSCPDLRLVVSLDSRPIPAQVQAQATGFGVEPMDAVLANDIRSSLPRVVDADMAAILYTSGSTGNPKGVVLSHRNLVAGAESVASYLENTAQDRIMAALPLSFDYGLSQITTAFLVGATVVLHNHLLPAETVRVMARERITGLAGVPPLWMQLTALEWPEAIGEHLRYFTNSGGAMPTHTLALLRERAPRALPYLMYGLTEAFRSTYLPPSEIDRRPTSIGKAIPNAEVMVVREDGTECDVDEPGELVHRGALVSMGYWNDEARTRERFRPTPGRQAGLMLPEHAVWSGDTVRRDAEGFLYFVGRRDEMIKTSGYRVSPTEIEEGVFRTGLVAEVAAFGVPHPMLGQAVVIVVKPAEKGADTDTAKLLAACKSHLPMYMLPAHVEWFEAALPRNANGKIDRKTLVTAHRHRFDDPPAGHRP